MRNVSAIVCASCLLWFAADAALAQDQIHWQPDLETAQRLAAQHRKLVLIHFWAPWCKPCRQLEQTVFSQPETGKALEANFVPVKLNADDSPATTRMYRVASLPTDVIITPDGRLVASLPSPQTQEQYLAQLNQVADGHRRLGAGGSATAQSAVVNPYATQAAATAASQQTPAMQQATMQQASLQQPVQQQPGVGQPPAGGQPPMATGQPMAAGQAPAMPQGELAAQAQFQRPAASPGRGSGTSRGGQSAAGQSASRLAPVGLDGCCPVTLVEQKRWARGDTQWGAVHRGRTYLFASSEAQHRFLANPDAYSPVIEGNDPVLALDNRQLVPGSRALGVFYEKRVYLFSSEETLRRFEQNPKRYAAEIVQAMR